MDSMISIEERDHFEFFGRRYEDLHKMRNNVKDIKWKKMIQEMKQILQEYDEMSKETNLHRFKTRQELLPSGKRAVNCLAMASTLFCEKFEDFEFEVKMDDITDRLCDNISSLLPYLSQSIFAVRIVEVMLYVMATIRCDYTDHDRRWCSLSMKCFTHPGSSQEIKLAAAILLCEFDEDKTNVIFEMYLFLKNILRNMDYFGFKRNEIEYGLSQIEDCFLKEIEENKLYESFGKRYQNILDLYNSVEVPGPSVVINVMRETLMEYDLKSRDSNILQIRNKKELLPTGKRSVNCVAIASALFCKLFQEYEIGSLPDLCDITNSLHSNIKLILPYISHNIIAVRIVEVMLYAMSAIREYYQDTLQDWSKLAADCFSHKGASPEIKLASAILIAKFDIDQNIINKEMFSCLNDSFMNETYYGFNEKEIKECLSKVQDKFSKTITVKPLVQEPRDSGFEEGDSKDTKLKDKEKEKSDQEKVWRENNKIMKNTKSYQEDISRKTTEVQMSKENQPCEKEESNLMIALERHFPWLILVGTIVALQTILLFRRK